MANEDMVDIELFISEIKKYREIWDLSSEEYHNRNKKRAAWVNVCCVVYDKFEEKEEKEKNEICNKVIKKWRNVRDNYLKSLKKKTKSGQAADTGRRYIYAQQLSFLQNAGATPDTESSFENQNEDLNQSGDQVDTTPTPATTTLASSSTDKPPRYDPNASKKRKRDIESALIEYIKTPIPPPTVIQSTPERNADLSFLESLLPYIYEFTPDQKLEFQTEVLNLIKRIRLNQGVTQNVMSFQNFGHTSNMHSTASDRPTTSFNSNLMPHSHSAQESPGIFNKRPTQLTELHNCTIPPQHNFNHGFTNLSSPPRQLYLQWGR